MPSRFPHSSAREAHILSNREGNATFVLNVNALSSRARPALPSAKSFLNKADWRQAVGEQIANSDDLNLLPGSELLTPVERQVSLFFIFLISIRELNSGFNILLVATEVGTI